MRIGDLRNLLEPSRTQSHSQTFRYSDVISLHNEENKGYMGCEVGACIVGYDIRHTNPPSCSCGGSQTREYLTLTPTLTLGVRRPAGAVLCGGERGGATPANPAPCHIDRALHALTPDDERAMMPLREFACSSYPTMAYPIYPIYPCETIERDTRPGRRCVIKLWDCAALSVCKYVTIHDLVGFIPIHYVSLRFHSSSCDSFQVSCRSLLPPHGPNPHSTPNPGPSVGPVQLHRLPLQGHSHALTPMP